jgi:death on curing protein
MAEPFYPTLADVLGLHAFIMRRCGEPPAPLRDEGLLESALQRPRLAALYDDADLIEQAAIFATAISQAQAFVQGNKRTAYLVADVFLAENGIAFVGDSLEMAEWLLTVARERSPSREAAVREFADWLRGQVAPAPAS